LATILFNNNGISPLIKEKRKLKSFLISIFEIEGVSLDKISYIFCKDDYLLQLNQKFLKHNTYTDVITFTLSEGNAPLIAEIYISIKRVKENAIQLKEEYYNELFRVMIHGILHLCGYSDHTLKEKLEIRKKENFYLTELFHVKRST
jgi:probable rRNA maturation factor